MRLAMKIFDYKNTPKTLLTPDIVAMLTGIHEHKGKQELYIEANADALNTLMEIAKIQSTKKEIMEFCPDISKITVERTLTSLVKNGYIVKIGGGRSVAYGKTDHS